jgi:hypothetical protein
MRTRTPVITMIPIIIRTVTATIRRMDIGAADIIGVGTAADTIAAADITGVEAAAIAAAVVSGAVMVATAAVVAVTAADEADKQSAKVVD